jgi:hypothetical protein
VKGSDFATSHFFNFTSTLHLRLHGSRCFNFAAQRSHFVFTEMARARLLFTWL